MKRTAVTWKSLRIEAAPHTSGFVFKFMIIVLSAVRGYRNQCGERHILFAVTGTAPGRIKITQILNLIMRNTPRAPRLTYPELFTNFYPHIEVLSL